jgi:hypothetical protein
MTLLEDMQAIGIIAADFTAFSEGQGVPASFTVNGQKYIVGVVNLGTKADTSGKYQTFAGGFFGILEAAFMDYEAFASGAPISLQERVGPNWYGETITRVPAKFKV